MPNPILYRILPAALVLMVGLVASPNLWAADYQWSVSIDGASHEGLDPDYPRAFLWIPPDCKQVRAIVLAENNLEEESIFEDAGFRKTLSDLGFAEIWITPRLNNSIHFRFDQGDDLVLAKVLKGLADASGYQELEFAPLVPMGHSATASFGWDIAAWNPGRTLAVLSISGQWPYFKDANMKDNSSPEWGDKTVDGVPGLTTKGEYEINGDTDGWYFHLKGDMFTKHPKTVFTQVVEPGEGHFNTTSEKNALICLYLRKVAQYRLPADTPLDTAPTLTPIDPTQTGWLFDEWHLKDGPSSPAAPVADYKGNKDTAFWAFDEEMAKAIEDFQSKAKNKPTVLVGFKQKDGLTPPRPDHFSVYLKFEPQDDGVTFKLTGGFWDTVPPTPDGAISDWGRMLDEGGEPVPEGATINHPQGEDDKIVLARVDGPIIQTAPDTFMIHPYRIGTHDVRRSNYACLTATYPGNDSFKPMVQQAVLNFPLANTTGTAQTIDFPVIPDQKAGFAPIKLAATSSGGLPVSYYVREGPAEVDLNGSLTFTGIPPRAKYPVTVTVVATQWGRSIDPKLQTAEPVERTFSITK